jgi:hypothetical protein
VLSSQWPFTESTRTQTTAMWQHRAKRTKKQQRNNKNKKKNNLRLFTLRHGLLKLSVYLKTAFSTKTHLAEGATEFDKVAYVPNRNTDTDCFEDRGAIFSASNIFLIRIVGGGVQAGSTRHVGHLMAYCTCLGWLWWWRIWWNEDWRGKSKYSEKTCPSATLSTTNPTWPDPGSNPGRRGGKPATNCLGYGAAFSASKDIY